MLKLSAIYHNRDILSLRTGHAIGHAYSPIINPDNLKIEGWYATEIGSRDSMVLPVREIRDLISKGLVVNDQDSITHPDDLVRMKKIINLDYELIGKRIVTDRKKRVGKVQDYSIDDQTMYIQKLYVNQSLFKGINKGQIIIDRTQIIRITSKDIVVKAPTEKLASRKRTPSRRSAAPAT